MGATPSICHTPDFPDLQVKPKIKKIWNGSIFGQLFGWSVGWSQRWADTYVTLAFDVAQVIPPLYREETYLGHIWDISETDLVHIWYIFGIYLGHI